MKITVCTANIGDNVKYEEIDHGWPRDIDFLYFTDKPKDIFDAAPTSSNYKFIHVPHNKYEDDSVCPKNRKLAKRIKIKYNEFIDECDWVIWIDAQRHFRCHERLGERFREYISQIPENIDIVFKTHPRNKTVFEELEEVKKKKLDNPVALDEWKNTMETQRFDKVDHVLSETNIIFFRYTPRNIPVGFYNEWWNKSTNMLRRDQLTLNYLIWKHSIEDHVVITPLEKTFPLKWLEKTPKGKREWVIKTKNPAVRVPRYQRKK